MAGKPHIRALIAYIERNIAGEFNVDGIARAGFVSPMQLYRDFYSLTGHTVKEYIRKRRLSNALALVKHSDKGLADIAYECGYSSQQAFCRCVKNATGQTPLQYKQSDECYYFPTFSSRSRRQICVAAETMPRTLCLKYYDSRLEGIERRAVGLLLKSLPEFDGRIFGKNGERRGDRFCYELYIEYDGQCPEGLKRSGFEGFNGTAAARAVFARTTVENADQQIGAAWDYLYTDWLKTSMFRQSDERYFEEYIHKGGAVKKLVLYLPVQKRRDFDTIAFRRCGEMLFIVSLKRGSDAERCASQAVMGYLAARHPDLVKTARQFYVARGHNEYACGVRIEQEMSLPEGGEVRLLRVHGGDYAVLEGECCGDGGVYQDILLSWARENGFAGDAPPFTVYQADGGFDEENIRTKTFIKLKNVKNG